MSTSPVKKFVLKFDLSGTRPSVVCKSTGFYSELYDDHTLSTTTHVKNLLVKHLIAREEAADYDNKQQQSTIWVYDMNNATNTTTTVYRAPRLVFWPMEGDFEAMQTALTQSKVPATFFDNQISKHIEAYGMDVTRENVRVYRDAYKDQISKLLLEEILKSESVATVRRWFDGVNGNSYASVNLRGETYQINVPMCYGHGDAVHVVMSALGFEAPRTMRSREFLTSIGIKVVDLDYSLKREMFTAAFYI